MEPYREKLASMTDDQLKQEWKKLEDFELLRKVEHEMAMRFLALGRYREGSEGAWLADKFLRIPEDFKEAYYRQDWFQAKYLYDSAIVTGLFIELPEEIRIRAFGSRQDERNPVEGLFPEWMVDHVMKECLVRNRLGFECVVYRVPGEIGFYGARQQSGTRYMAAEENPAFRAG